MLRNTGLALLTLAAVSLHAQSLSGPLSGMLFDSQTKSMRLIVGVPGAAYLGPESAPCDLAAVSPDGGAVLALSAGRLALLRTSDPGAPARLLADDGDGALRIVWNHDSSAAAIAFHRRIELWRNLNHDPERLPLHLPTTDSPLSGLAVDPSGLGAAATFGGNLYYLDAEQARLLTTVEKPGGLAFSGNTLYLGDRAASQVLAIGNFQSSPEVALLAAGIEDPVALSLSPGSRSLLVAGAASRSLLWLNPESGEITARLELDFQPSRLDRFSGQRPLYLLSDRATTLDPVQILDAGNDPAVYFIPAGNASQVEE
ncbi:MAG: hypothetical protein FJW20_16400 [Acidimicrobiia bacterium]|nr:hypothetical protein [Acidimicrobiia bacterium]